MRFYTYNHPWREEGWHTYWERRARESRQGGNYNHAAWCEEAAQNRHHRWIGDSFHIYDDE